MRARSALAGVLTSPQAEHLAMMRVYTPACAPGVPLTLLRAARQSVACYWNV